MKPKEISKSVLKRLPGYLTYLKSLPEDGPANISATALAAALSMGRFRSARTWPWFLTAAGPRWDICGRI